MFRENVKKLTAADLGCSENEFSDFLIDMWELVKEVGEIKKTNSFTIMPKGELITVTLTNDCFYKKED